MLACHSVLLGGGYCAEARALFDAMTTQPPADRKRVINTLISALKNAGIWQTCDAIWVLAAHTAQAGALNWINPTQTALALTGTAGTWTTDRGWAGAGGTSYLVGPTAYNALTQYTLNNAHISLWNRTNAQSNGSQLGNLNTSVTLIRTRNTTDQYVSRVNASAATVTVASNTDATGFYMSDRIDATNCQAYKNGAQVGTANVGSAAIPAEAPTIGEGSLASTTNQSAFVSVGGSQGARAADYYAAVLAYMQAVGAA